MIKYSVCNSIQGHPECIFEPKSPWIGSILQQLVKYWKHVAQIHILCIDGPDWASWTLKGQELDTNLILAYLQTTQSLLPSTKIYLKSYVPNKIIYSICTSAKIGYLRINLFSCFTIHFIWRKVYIKP